MNELIAQKIRLLKQMIIVCNGKADEDIKHKDYKSEMFFRGCASAYTQALSVLQEIQTAYETTQQSLEEDLKFLRGE